MTTPAEQYRALVARLEGIQEGVTVSDVPAPDTKPTEMPPPYTYNPTRPSAPDTPPRVNGPTAPASVDPIIQALTQLSMDEQKYIVYFLGKYAQSLGPNARRLFAPQVPQPTAPTQPDPVKPDPAQQIAPPPPYRPNGVPG